MSDITHIPKEMIPADVADLFTDWASRVGEGDRVEFANRIVNGTHRTIQQSFFGLLMHCVSQWAGAFQAGAYDLRNEYTVSKCRSISGILNGFTKAPFI